VCLPTPYSLKLELQLEEVVVPAKSPCEGVSLPDSGLREQLGVIVVAIRRASDERIEGGIAWSHWESPCG